MRYTVLVKTRVKEPRVTLQDDGTLAVAVAAPPTEGQANEAVIRAVANHFGVAPSTVRLVAGTRGRRKIIDVGP